MFQDEALNAKAQ